MTRDSDGGPALGGEAGVGAAPIDYAAVAREVFAIEAAAVAGLADGLDGSFAAVIDTILGTKGRVIVCGMGKSGIIGKKIAGTLASTGTPSFFMHPGEAFHGDLGMVTGDDIFLAISNSGETEELVKLLPFLRDNGNLTVAMTGNAGSTLARNASFHLPVRVAREACPLQLAPTASTTATLAMGDAVAVALMRARGFQPRDFARFHPGGLLGRRLLHRVRDDMHTEALPFVVADAPVEDVIGVMTRGRLGIALVGDADRRRATGIITDGDLRRAIERNKHDFFAMTAARIMTPAPISIAADSRMDAAMDLMHRHRITALVVVDDGRVVGVVQK